jgi:hypothetical protein
MTKPPPSPQADEPPANEAELSRSWLDAAIRASVIAALGRPPWLYQVAVRRLWSGHYRVNVVVGIDPHGPSSRPQFLRGDR